MLEQTSYYITVSLSPLYMGEEAGEVLEQTSHYITYHPLETVDLVVERRIWRREFSIFLHGNHLGGKFRGEKIFQTKVVT